MTSMRGAWECVTSLNKGDKLQSYWIYAGCQHLSYALSHTDLLNIAALPSLLLPPRHWSPACFMDLLSLSPPQGLCILLHYLEHSCPKFHKAVTTCHSGLSSKHNDPRKTLFPGCPGRWFLSNLTVFFLSKLSIVWKVLLSTLVNFFFLLLLLPSLDQLWPRKQ